MTAFYNEHDHEAAEWLRSLIAAGQIAPGIVDERSIEDVRPDELAGYTQVHLFAGIGIWSLALRAAGVPDDYPVWTASCPCQPFSSAGKGAGFDDERHLWPAAYHLISQCRPAKVIGEQVASKDTQPWIDLVHADLEALGYAFGCVPFPSAGIGAPHIRERAYWFASAGVTLGDTGSTGLQRHSGHVGNRHESGWLDTNSAGPVATAGGFGWLADTDGKDQCGRGIQGCRQGDGAGARQSCERSEGLCADGGLADPECAGIRGEGLGTHGAAPGGMQDADGQRQWLWLDAGTGGDGLDQSRPGPANGFWRDADWLYCRDGKWRPVEPGLKPLAHGMPRSMGALPPELQRLAELAGLSAASLKSAKAYRTGSLKGYGNAINAKAAQAFIECVMEAA